MRISPQEWPLWTLKSFYLAYQGWKEINREQPWQIGRAISFYILSSQGAKISKYSDVFQMESDSKEPRSSAIIREPTKEEREMFEKLVNGR